MSNFTYIEKESIHFPLQDEYKVVEVFFGIVFTVSATVGIVVNIINIYVFFKMGLEDGVTLSFQILSFADLGVVCSRLIQGIGFCVGYAEVKKLFILYIDPMAVRIFASHIGHMLNTLSALTTAYLAVARCMCIVKPLHFKNDFSQKRSSIALTFLALFSLACFLPVFATMGMSESINPETNRSRLYLSVVSFRETVINVVEIITEMFVPIMVEVIIVICMVIMAKALLRAHQFRQSISVEKSKTQAVDVKSEDQSGKVKGTLDSSNNKLTGKDLQVVQQVVLISAVLLACNTPKIITSLYGVVDDEFAFRRKYQYIYLTLRSVRTFGDIINASVNIFIYLKYNSKFRHLLFSSE